VAFEFKFPDVGEGITEGEVVRWHVQEGERVKEDQVLLEVETDKAVVEIPSPVGGVIRERRVKEGEIIHVGDVMVVIEEEGKAGAVRKVEAGKETPVQAAAPVQETARSIPGRGEGKAPGSVAAAPATRRLAREMSVDLQSVRGTGPGGRITPEDVQAAARGVHPAPVGESSERVAPKGVAPEERIPMRGVRKRVSEAMMTSIRKIPHVTHVDEVEVTRLIALRDRIIKRWGGKAPKLSYFPFVVKAVALSLKEFPAFNASVDDEKDEIVYRHDYHIGMATATPDGLIVPVIRHADRLGILAIAGEVDRLAELTRSRKVPLEDLRGATFSVTNYGSIGGLFGTPIIHHPETAILGVGKFFKKLVMVDGEPVERDFVYLSLSFDHRVADGADAARFVNRIKEYIEEPETHFMELI